MRSALLNRTIDFIGRSTVGGENGFVRDKRLLMAAAAIAIIAVLSRSTIPAVILLALIVAVLVSDVLRYNREHPNG